MKKLFFVLTVLAQTVMLDAQINSGIKIGAYYFDGWSGLTQGHITPALTKDFTNRRSIWGWVTSSQDVMEKQIDVAASHGINFFDFCWYPSKTGSSLRDNPLNRSLNFFKAAKNNNKLDYCLLIANHKGYLIGPTNWNRYSEEWISCLRDSQYLRSNNQKLLSFFLLQPLIDSFGSVKALQDSILSFRTRARQDGVENLKLGLCSFLNKQEVQLAQQVGFDYFTGYNYHEAGFKTGVLQIPIDTLINTSVRIWNKADTLNIAYMPVLSLNWDPRPWSSPKQDYADAPFYVGYSYASNLRFSTILRQWLQSSPKNNTIGKVAVLYAWNEYGEGGWLSPSDVLKDSLLLGIQQGLKR